MASELIWQDDWLAVHQGDCQEVMRGLPDQSINCVVTSPPYWSLRDYEADGQIGLEDTPTQYVERIVSVFQDVRRILRDDGTVWLNLGDTYAAERSGTEMPAETLAGGEHGHGDKKARRGRGGASAHRRASAFGLKHKDLIGIPWMCAFALRDDGWWLRSDIIWHKPNASPSSVEDRPTSSHEYVFLLAKSETYYYDHLAVRTQPSPATIEAMRQRAKREDKKYKHDDQYGDKGMRNANRVWSDPEAMARMLEGANLRDVWKVATVPYKGSHTAVFPPKLITPCIKAGCPEGGTVLDPFAGTGTTGVVANFLNRKSVLIDINVTTVMEELMERNKNLPLGI